MIQSQFTVSVFSIQLGNEYLTNLKLVANSSQLTTNFRIKAFMHFSIVFE